MKNKSIIGLDNFIVAFYDELSSGLATGWWSGVRRNDYATTSIKGNTFTETYDLVEYIKDNYKDLTKEDVEEVAEFIKRTFYVLTVKRVYHWEASEGETEEVVVEEVDPTIPDFKYAKSLEPDKQALKDYAESFGIEIDSRKAFKNMMSSFQGKYHATKNRVE